MVNIIKRLSWLIMLCIMMLFPKSILAEEQVVTVGFTNEDDEFIDAAAADNSYAAMFMSQLFEAVNTDYEYQFDYVRGSRTQMEAALRLGTIDIMIAEPQAYDWNGEARYIYDYDDALKVNGRYSSDWLAIYVPDNSKIYYDDAASLQNKVIGVINRDFHRRLLANYLDEKNISMDVKVYVNQAQMEEDMKNGKIDAMVSSTNQTEYRRIAMYLGYSEKYIYVSGERPAFCQTLNRAYNRVIQKNQYFLHDLAESCYPLTSYLSFTREQITYIKNSKPLTVVYPNNKPPEIYDDSSGQMSGKLADYARLIEENCRLTFNYVSKDNYNECIEALKRGEADIILGAYGMENYLKENGFTATIPFTSIGLSVIGRYDVRLDKELTVGLWNDISVIGAVERVKESFPDWRYEIFETDIDTIKAISEGGVDVAIVSSDRASTLLLNAESNIGVVYIMEAAQGIALALNEGEDTKLLKEILNQGIMRITPEESKQIETSQTAAIVRDLSFRDFLWTNRWLLFSIAFLILVLVSWVYLIRRNRRIKYEARYTAMSKQLEIQCQHYNVLKEYQEAIRTYRHDWNNHTMVMSACLERGDVEGLKSYLADMSGALPVFSLVDTGNPILDAILSDRLERARGLGIHVESEIIIPSSMQMDAMDINSIFSNCLDNAIEACQRVMERSGEKPFIKLILREKRGNLLFKMQNSTLHVNRTEEGGPMTWKNGREHGLGLRSVKSTVEKYNGYFEENDENGVFYTELTINHIWED